MKKQLATFALAILMGVLGFAVSGVALAGNGNPQSPPGRPECGHGNSAKPCKDDSQPDKGKDCEAHGNHGGVNEDHCKGEETPPTDTTPDETTPDETTPDETTPDETTPDETTPDETTPDDTTPTETTPTDTTPQGTVPTDVTPNDDGGNNPYTTPATAPDEPSSTQSTEPSSAQPTTEPSSSEPSQGTPGILAKPPVAPAAKKQAPALSTTASATKPTRLPQAAPVTL